MTKTDLDPDCWSKSLDLLSRRPHFRRELGSKLSRRGFPESQVEGALDRLAELGLLDDRACARDLAAGAFRRRGYGPARIRAELERKGAAEEAIDEVLASSGREDELSLARSAASRWRGGKALRPADEGRKLREQLARHLARKGFSTGVILTVLDELPGTGDPDRS